jgi:hypothetical protein
MDILPPATELELRGMLALAARQHLPVRARGLSRIGENGPRMRGLLRLRN